MSIGMKMSGTWNTWKIATILTATTNTYHLGK